MAYKNSVTFISSKNDRNLYLGLICEIEGSRYSRLPLLLCSLPPNIKTL